MTFVNYIIFAVFPLAMIYAAVSDLVSLTIPNRVSLILAGTFVVLVPFVPGMDLATFGLHLSAGAVVLAIGFILFAFGWIGGGDAKIAAAAALWVGLSHTLEFVMWTSLFGGALSLIILMARRRLLPVFAVRYEWVTRLHSAETGVPYGVALGAAAIMVYPQTIWMTLIGG